MGATAPFFDTKRTWSLLKDEILVTYLRPYLMKITTTRRPVVIVDCFASKGRFDDGQPGSPVLIAEAVRRILRERPGADVHAFFIERKYHAELVRNTAGYENCRVLPGLYQEHVGALAKGLAKGTNVLVFVDPYGIKSLDFGHFRDLSGLRLGSLELILNLNTFGFLREGCRLLSIAEPQCEEEPGEDGLIHEEDQDGPNSIERMDAIANGSYWQGILKDFHEGRIDMHEAERRFSARYSDELRSLFRFVTGIPVKFRRAHLPKYRLTFGTQSADGLILMADKMCRTWRDFASRDRGGQGALFEEIDYPDMVEFEGYSVDEDILSLCGRSIDLKELLVRLFSKYGMTFSEGDILAHIRQLGAQSRLSLHRDPSRTSTGRLATSMDYRKYRITVERI